MIPLLVSEHSGVWARAIEGVFPLATGIAGKEDGEYDADI